MGRILGRMFLVAIVFSPLYFTHVLGGTAFGVVVWALVGLSFVVTGLAGSPTGRRLGLHRRAGGRRL